MFGGTLVRSSAHRLSYLLGIVYTLSSRGVPYRPEPRYGPNGSYTSGVATKRVYTYPQVADRIEEELGVRPSLSSLRSAAAEGRRRGRRGGTPRLIMGMPDPEPRASATAVAHFSRTAIDAWLRRHPRRRYEAATQAVTAFADGPNRQLETAVRRARSAGVSWTDITAALSAGSATPASRAWTHRRFSHLDEK